MACVQRKPEGTRETRLGEGRRTQPETREGEAGPRRESERFINSEEARNERGAKEPQFQGDVTSGKRAEIGESLPPPFKLWELQEALHAKAKGNPSYRFYALYDKLCRADVLAEAWRRCLANGGVAGVDGVSFEKIEAYGVSRWIGELAQELRERSYRPAAVRRVYIPKPDGKQRPTASAGTSDFMFPTQPLTQPIRAMSVHCAIDFAHGPKAKVIAPASKQRIEFFYFLGRFAAQCPALRLLANSLDNPGNLLRARSRADIFPPVPGRVASPKAVSQEVEGLLGHLTQTGLLSVDP